MYMEPAPETSRRPMVVCSLVVPESTLVMVSFLTSTESASRPAASSRMTSIEPVARFTSAAHIAAFALAASKTKSATSGSRILVVLDGEVVGGVGGEGDEVDEGVQEVTRGVPDSDVRQ